MTTSVPISGGPVVRFKQTRALHVVRLDAEYGTPQQCADDKGKEYHEGVLQRVRGDYGPGVVVTSRRLRSTGHSYSLECGQ